MAFVLLVGPFSMVINVALIKSKLNYIDSTNTKE